MDQGHSHDSCGCPSGVGGVYQTLDEMDFEKGPWNAASTGDYPSIVKYLQNGGSPSVRDSAGYTALHYAAMRGYENITKALLQNGALVNAQTKAGQATPLHRAASKGCLEIVKLLLRHKADVCLQDADGKTALHKAVDGNHPEICQILVNFQPSCKDVADNQYKIPKDYITSSLNYSVIYKILK